ncbi:MAG: 2-C-methyl-D-erythritol 4-phosphate cytidylyltransferase [Acholeplasmatales bacterium]|nr:2-C-methyl-D-erythritol 4-phosphate cytidylyltransferase [Acholeplasmatales bacterium]
MISVIILMAGRGTRMGIDKNKILLEVNKKPIFKYSLDLFSQYDFEIICVINKLDEDYIKPYLNSNIKCVYGGNTRTESVYNGLKEVTGDYVLIHDAARPLLDKKVVDEIISKKDNSDCILTYLPVKNTIKEINDNKLNTLNRNKLISAVTPQCGKAKLFKDAYSKAINSNLEFTDDVSIIEHYYNDAKIDLVLANEEVFKVTTMLDYKLLKAILE